MKPVWIACLGSLLLLSACQPGASSTPAPPNFLLIQLDDLGWDDLGLHGNAYLHTPHLDQLGGESVRFDRFYVHAVCAPTRASLLTGRHFLRTGVSHVHGGKDYLHRSEHTLAEALATGGYATGMWGKWHSGNGPGYDPWDRGFQEAYKALLYQHRDPEGSLNGQAVAHPGRWSAGVITDYALDFIARHRDTSFLAYCAYLSPHAPLDAPDSLIGLYTAQGLSPQLATLYAMIDQVDQEIGRLLQGLEAMGLAERTVVLFLSDNGPAVLNDRLTDADRATRYHTGLRGHKGNLWENGVKSPLFLRWAGTLPPQEVSALADVTDLMPTLLDLAGVALPAGYLPLDGRSLRPLLAGDSAPAGKYTFDYVHPAWPPTDRPWTPEGLPGEYRPISPAERAQMAYTEQILSARDARFKLMLHAATYPNTPPLIRDRVLIDMQADPQESRNVIEAHPAVAGSLEKQLETWFQTIKAVPYAFGSPSFLIREPETGLPAKGAFQMTDGLRKTFAWVDRWETPGAGLGWALDVAAPGAYALTLEIASPDAVPHRWEAHLGPQQVTATGAGPTLDLGTLNLSPGPDTLWLYLRGPAAAPSLRLQGLHLKAR